MKLSSTKSIVFIASIGVIFFMLSVLASYNFNFSFDPAFPIPFDFFPMRNIYSVILGIASFFFLLTSVVLLFKNHRTLEQSNTVHEYLGDTNHLSSQKTVQSNPYTFINHDISMGE